jgi:hypothetical protein
MQKLAYVSTGNEAVIPNEVLQDLGVEKKETPAEMDPFLYRELLYRVIEIHAYGVVCKQYKRG